MQRQIINAVFVALSMFDLYGCGTAVRMPQMDLLEQLRQDELSQQSIWQAKKKSMVFLERPRSKAYLAEVSRELQLNDQISLPLNIFIIRHTQWMPSSAPVANIYVPTRLIQQFDFETEFIGCVAIELEWLRTRYYANVLNGQELRPKLEQYRELLPQAVERMYMAGYDPRGLISLLTKYEQLSGNHDSSMNWKSLIEYVRQVIFSKPPLINPTMRSNAFIEFKESVQ